MVKRLGVKRKPVWLALYAEVEAVRVVTKFNSFYDSSVVLGTESVMRKCSTTHILYEKGVEFLRGSLETGV